MRFEHWPAGGSLRPRCIACSSSAEPTASPRTLVTKVYTKPPISHHFFFAKGGMYLHCHFFPFKWGFEGTWRHWRLNRTIVGPEVMCWHETFWTFFFFMLSLFYVDVTEPVRWDASPLNLFISCYLFFPPANQSSSGFCRASPPPVGRCPWPRWVTSEEPPPIWLTSLSQSRAL